MAILTGLPQRPRKAGQAVLASALALLASCSGTSQVTPIEAVPPSEQATLIDPPDEALSQDEPPSTRVFLTRLEVTWSVGIDEPPTAPDDRLLYLVPASPIEGVETDATLRRVDAGGVPEYSVSVRRPADSLLSVKASPAMSCHVTPDGATWEPVEIRGVEGCEFTNEAGLYFAKWAEGATRFQYSSFDITGAEAREMLAEWEPLE
ncbi:MAG: hypothetical protein OXC00_06915 [Acidimicrobiaceae bacterium]|nr:hypothetical protein [Acidimicrobiaceae bacterium]